MTQLQNIVYDVSQDYGNDLIVDPATGDLQLSSGVLLSEQRIIRRLLTAPITVANPADYLQEPLYGAGLGQFIGKLDTDDIKNQIKGLITSQMYLEDSVAQFPAPVIDIQGLPNQINCTITYTNILTNSQAVISFSLPANNFNPATITT